MGLTCMKYILGFDSEVDAAMAYDRYALHLQGDKCKLITPGKTNFDYTGNELRALLRNIDLSDATRRT